MFWIVFCTSNTRTWILFAQKHISNIIKEIVFGNSIKLPFLKMISLYMLQICFWEKSSQSVVFEVSKIIQSFDLYNWVSVHVLVCTQHRHLNIKLPYCDRGPFVGLLRDYFDKVTLYEIFQKNHTCFWLAAAVAWSTKRLSLASRSSR